MNSTASHLFTRPRWELVFWFVLTLGLAFADWLEHVSRTLDVYRQFPLDWLFFTVSIYLSSLIAVLVFVLVFYTIIAARCLEPGSSWLPFAKYGSSALGILWAIVQFPFVANIIRDAFIPYYKHGFSIESGTFVVVPVVFTILWLLVYRTPWHWNLRPLHQSAAFLVFLVSILYAGILYSSNSTIHAISVQPCCIYTIKAGEGYTFAEVVKVSPPELTVTLVDSVFSERPTEREWHQLSHQKENDSRQRAHRLSIVNFLAWNPEFLTKDTVASVELAFPQDSQH